MIPNSTYKGPQGGRGKLQRSGAVLAGSELSSHFCAPWPRAHRTPTKHVHLESSTRTLPGREFHSVAIILITITAVIIAPHHLQSADAGLSILFLGILLICILLRMVRHRATLHQHC